MKTKYILMIMALVVASYFFMITKDEMIDFNILGNDKVSTVLLEKKPEMKMEKGNITSNHLTVLAEMISPPSDTELQENWQDEYGCAGSPECFEELSAQSYEEALWMKRKGYPSMSAIKMLQELSKKELIELSVHGNSNAKKLLAIDALQKDNLKQAKHFSRASIAYGNKKETFGYRLLAETYMKGKELMLASFQLRVASILGDTAANQDFLMITNNTPAVLINSWNEQAFKYLSRWMGTPVSDWTNDPRPSGNGGG